MGWRVMRRSGQVGAGKRVNEGTPERNERANAVSAVSDRTDLASPAGLDVRVVTVPTGSVAGAYTRGERLTGTSKIVVDPYRRVLVGATFTGPDTQELLHAATVALVGRVPLETLWHAVPSFPTVSEVWLRLLEQYGL
jgi:dihydrolipoamide dehydrogenase